MNAEESFHHLMSLLQSGDRDAAGQVFNRFARRLIGLARSQLDEKLRVKVDPEDVVQSVYRSFFTRQRAGQFDLIDWESVWGILAVITVRKCSNCRAYYQTARRDVQREASVGAEEESDLLNMARAREPTPSEAAMLRETVEQLMHGLDERDRRILQSALQGYTVTEISVQVGRAECTVRRTIHRVRNQLRRLRDEEVA